MESKEKKQSQKQLNTIELEKVNGGIVVPVTPDDDHQDSDVPCQ